MNRSSLGDRGADSPADYRALRTGTGLKGADDGTHTNSLHGATYTTTKTREELDHIEEQICSPQGTNSERAFARGVWVTLCGVEALDIDPED